MASKKNKTPGSVVLVPILLVGFFIMAVKNHYISIPGFGGGSGGSSNNWKPSSDGPGRDEFKVFSEALGVVPAIALSIRSTTDEYEVRAEASRTGGRGDGAFVVKPRHYRQFVDAPIEALVEKGLSCFGPGKQPLAHPLWQSWSIETNSTERAWKVALSGIRPAGSITLQVGDASAEIRVELPLLFPIWKKTIALFGRDGFMEVGGHRIYAKKQVPAGRDGKPLANKAIIAPDLERNLCGFRVLCVTSHCAWLEIVYAEPNPALDRDRWPDLSLDYKVLDSGANYSVVRFEGGYEAQLGASITFPEGDMMLLDATGILSRNAILFRYRDSSGREVADVLCLSLSPGM